MNKHSKYPVGWLRGDEMETTLIISSIQKRLTKSCVKTEKRESWTDKF